MKRLLVFGSSHKIGLTGQLADFACACLDAGVPRADFLCISGEREQVPGLFKRLDAHSVAHVKINGLDDHRNLFRLAREFDAHVRRFVPGVVHAQTNWQMAIATIVKYLYGQRYAILYTVHGYRHNYRFRSFIARYLMGIFLFFFADKVITPSSFLKKKFGFVKDKAEVIYLGVENDLWKEYSPPEFSGTKRLIFPGEFRQGKNQDILIRTVKAYMARTGDDDIELYLPGQGDKLEYCKSLCRQLGIEAKVHFPGFIDRAEMLRLYLLCQFAVIPGNVETFGLCITEPYMLGRVVISRHVGVADDLITEGETGFFFDNEKDLPAVLEHLFADTEKCIRVSKNAYENRSILSWGQICNHYLKAIESL